MTPPLRCFTAYDVRGRVPVDLDAEIAQILLRAIGEPEFHANGTPGNPGGGPERDPVGERPATRVAAASSIQVSRPLGMVKHHYTVMNLREQTLARGA